MIDVGISPSCQFLCNCQWMIEGYKLRHIKLNYLLGTMTVRGRWDNGILSFLDFSVLIYNHYDNSSVFQDLLEMFQWCLPSPKLLWMQVVSL